MPEGVTVMVTGICLFFSGNNKILVIGTGVTNKIWEWD